MNGEGALLTRYALIAIQYAILLLIYLFIFRVITVMRWDLGNRVVTDGKPLAQQAVLRITNSAGLAELPRNLVPLQQNITIGRNEHNDIVIPETWVSGEHASIFFRGGRYYVNDLHSTNGTLCNQVCLKNQEQLLQNGDIIQIGDVTMRFEE